MSGHSPTGSPWDERYGFSREEYYYGTEPNDFLRENAERIRAGGSVLCLAEGEGRNAVHLAGLGLRVTAVDSSRVGFEKLQALARTKGVQVNTVLADLADFEIAEQQWDAIVSVWAHLPPALRKRVHAACTRGLKAGGFFVLEAYTPRQLEFKTGGPPTSELLMTLPALQIELEGLSFLVARETEREVREGRGHHGPSAVVQILAMKK